jgi:hypothetical protein
LADFAEYLDGDAVAKAKAAAPAGGLVVGGELVIERWRLTELLNPADGAGGLTVEAIRARLRAEPIGDQSEGPA